MNFIANLFCAVLMLIAGTLNISQAIDAFQKQHYFLFGLHVMIVIVFAAFMIKYSFNAIGG